MSSVDRGTGAGRPRKKFREIEERWCKRQKRERDQEDLEDESDRKGPSASPEMPWILNMAESYAIMPLLTL